MITVKSAVFVDMNHLGRCSWAMPMPRSTWLTGPSTGWNSSMAIQPMATMEVRLGKKNTVLKNPPPNSFRFRARARINEKAMVSGTLTRE